MRAPNYVLEQEAMGHRFSVRCMMCGRTAGLVHEGVFRRLPETPPLALRAGRSACGFCHGSLYLEADDGPGSFPMLESLKPAERRRAQPQRADRRRAS